MPHFFFSYLLKFNIIYSYKNPPPMKKFNINTDFKIKLPIITLSLFILIGILSYQFNNSNFYTISTIIGFLTIILALFSLAGLYNTIKKSRNPLSIKRILSLIAISLIACTLLYIIVENIFEAIKRFI